MNNPIPRRAFLKSASAIAAATALSGDALAAAPDSRIRLETFDYDGVRLLDSRWKDQVQQARDYYFNLADDDILKGFRAAAGLPAPGTTLGGWCEKDSSPIFGQWLSGMARLSRATGDTALHDKAVRLLTGWGKTVKPNGDCGMRHYAWEKLVCGLVDMRVYGREDSAVPLLERVTDFAMQNFSRANRPASRDPHGSFSGNPSEWYTLGENLYRAYQATGNEKFRTFADAWLYPAYWNQFADTAAPTDAYGFHAYSHVNTFSSAAMHYEVTGDPTTLRILKNAYDYLQNTQCYATGGYGPDERLLAPNGSLGAALENRPNTFETVCGSWAGFKLSRYLMRFTGEARYGDWIERLLYNGVGAALPLSGRGRNFYYSDYRSAGGMKVYRYDNFTCCSGAYIQSLADYHNLIYYRDASSLYVNLYVPSEVTWKHASGEVKLQQRTGYPVSETSALTVETPQPVEFALRFRVPGWSKGATFSVNGADASVPATPGDWATIKRVWKSGDRVDVRIPLHFRWQSVDAQHSDRAAIVRGAVVMPLEFRYLEPLFHPPDNNDDLNNILTPDTGTGIVHTLPNGAGAYRVKGTDGRPLMALVRPFYQYTEDYPYLMYIDKKSWPVKYW
ncbi:MAG TPA: beta-L-arabinofuranosidase domain-containing protein [Bryobacteraceae bacterium]|nr:beta-L-arabinofuranosidase domain-containing protein [Bryobacteraceae bacterium]